MILVVFCLYCIICFANSNGEFVSDYIINNEKCQLPNFPPFSDELKPILKKLPPVNCSVRDLLTYTSVENNTAYLHIKTENINQYYDENEMVNCFFCYVRRSGSAEEPDTGISNSACTFFNSTVKLEENTIEVECIDDRTRTVYKNVHELITVSNSINHRLHKLTKTLKKQNKKALSVLFVVIDGISRISFGRNMAKTKKFLLNNDFSEFVGYSKIDDNTIPNFNALITGLDYNHTKSICKPGVTGQLDFCPMIWYDFKKHGYVTAYAEDWAYLNTYGHNGFKNPPTDYYFKPYFEAATNLGTVKVDTAPYCTGPETDGDRTLNLARDFTSTFKNKPSFGIFWMNTFSHNHINSPSRFDDKMLEFFKDLKNNGILNNTLILLLSDHGVRNGRIRLTRQGWYEERLPNNFISIPSWFKEEYPEKYVNLKMNSKKFTSTFDVYMTVQDALSMAVDDYEVKPSQGCPNCASLFSRIPEVRSCSEAGVPEEWCTCLGLLDNNHPDLTDEIKKETLDFINNSDIISNFSPKIKDLVSFRMTYFHKHAYSVVTVQSDSIFYLIVLRGSESPIKFDKILNLITIGKSEETFNYI